MSRILALAVIASLPIFASACGKEEGVDTSDNVTSVADNQESPKAGSVEKPAEPDFPCEVSALTTMEKNLIDEFLTGNQFVMDVSEDPWKGDKNGELIMVTYESFTCGHCEWWSENMTKPLANRHSEDGLKISFRHFPLDLGCKDSPSSAHEGASLAALAARAAQNQGQFWNMHDVLFSKMMDSANEEKGPHFTRPMVDSAAQDIGLDMEQFKAFMDSEEADQWLREHLDEACSYRDASGERVISGTPAVFLDGYEVNLNAMAGTNGERRFERFVDAMVKRFKLRQCAEQAGQTLDPESEPEVIQDSA